MPAEIYLNNIQYPSRDKRRDAAYDYEGGRCPAACNLRRYMEALIGVYAEKLPYED